MDVEMLLDFASIMAFQAAWPVFAVPHAPTLVFLPQHCPWTNKSGLQF